MVHKIFLNDRIIVTAILINSISIFLLSFKHLSGHSVLYFVDHSITVFFIIEMVVKLRHYGIRAFFQNNWNLFDFIIIAFSSTTMLTLLFHPADLTFLLVLRLVRILRFVRLLRFIPGIEHLMRGTIRSLKASLLVIISLMVYIYILAIISCSLYGDVAPEYFDNPALSIYSTFKLFTIEGWYEIPDLVAQRTTLLWGSLTRVYFMVVTFTGGIMGFSLVNAVFVDEMTMDNTESLEQQVDRLERKINALVEAQGLVVEEEEPVDKIKTGRLD